MKKVLLALCALIGTSLGMYGLADAAQTLIGTTPLKGGQSLSVTCSGSKLRTTRISTKAITATCWGRAPVTSTAPVSSTTTTTTTTATSTSTTQSSGGDNNCTNPTFSTSEPTGTDNTDPNDGAYWWVDNDAWSGSHGPQTLYVCNQSSWYAVTNQPNVQGQVETYPNTEYDIGGRNNSTYPSTRPISDYNSISSSFSEAYPSAGSWDGAYDLWLNNWSTEIMIWNQWAGTQSYWPGQATTALTLDGVPYHFLNNGGELMFFRDTPVASGSVDILAALQWLVSQGIVQSTDAPTQLEYGVEVCSTVGSETFPMKGLTFGVS